MSRITGADAKSLMEAYGAVYTPQELTEEQVWEGVGEWVNALLEEGYDLSEYTWEDMYEAYLEQLDEGPGMDIFSTPAAQKSGYKSSSDGKLYKNYNDALAAKNSRMGTLGMQQGLQRTFGAGGGNAAVAQGRSPLAVVTQGSTNLQRQQRPVTAATPAARPAAPAATPAARPAAPATTPAAKAAPAAAAPSTAATGFKLAQQGVNLAAPKKPSLRSDIDDLKNMGTASRQRQGLTQSFDPFDVVLGHLIDEGYADTEESATAIMANMSEEWRQSIFEAQEARNNPEKYEAEQRKRKEKDKKQIAMNDPHTGINSPAFAAFMKQQGR